VRLNSIAVLSHTIPIFVDGFRVEHCPAGVSAFTQPKPAALSHAGVIPHQTNPAHPQVSVAAAAADGAH